MSADVITLPDRSAALDWAKPLRTRNGRRAWLMACLRPDMRSADGQAVAVAVQNREGAWTIETYYVDGTFDRERSTSWDLFNPPSGAAA